MLYVSNVFKCFLRFPPFFALLRHSFFGIYRCSSPSNSLGPNPNGRCSPLSFGFLVVSICLVFVTFSKLCLSSIMPFFLALCYVFLRVFPEFPSYNCLFFPEASSSFLGFSPLSSSAMVPSQLFTIILHFPSFSFVLRSFFPTSFLPFSAGLGRIEPRRLQIA